jgi:hypothetical protein
MSMGYGLCAKINLVGGLLGVQGTICQGICKVRFWNPSEQGRKRTPSQDLLSCRHDATSTGGIQLGQQQGRAGHGRVPGRVRSKGLGISQGWLGATSRGSGWGTGLGLLEGSGIK